MSAIDPIRLAKLLELAGHPSSNEGEALNSLRAVRTLLQRSGRSLSDLSLSTAGGGRASAGPDIDGLRSQLQALAVERDRLRAENAKLRRENRRIEVLKAEIDVLREAQATSYATAVPPGDQDDAQVPITANFIAVFDLLSEWRSIADLVEKLGSALGQTGVKRIVRLLDDKGLLRSVESWPTRYRLRFEGELGDAAKTFRSRIEDARLSG